MFVLLETEGIYIQKVCFCAAGYVGATHRQGHNPS